MNVLVKEITWTGAPGLVPISQVQAGNDELVSCFGQKAPWVEPVQFVKQRLAMGQYAPPLVLLANQVNDSGRNLDNVPNHPYFLYVGGRNGFCRYLILVTV